jgi:hypothetical protein
MKEAPTASHLLGLIGVVIAVRDERACYQLDDSCNKSAFPNDVEELLGVLVGYLSGSLHPETHETLLRVCSDRRVEGQ